MPILSPDAIEFISRSPEQTRRVGARLGMLLSGGDVIALEGNLGSGKTVLAQGIGIGWGATTSLISPTFVIIRRHTRNQDNGYFYHVDLYRIASPTEAEHLGLTEMLGDPGAVCVVEWAEHAADLFPAETLWVSLRVLDEQRRSLTFHANGDHHHVIQEKLRKGLAGY
jgi:tRNA threonylcarbamoyladenosine biosynthesis protein TsaE